MKTLQTLESAFLSGKLPKPEYITQMYELHSRLFEYAEFITRCDIEEISITPNCVKVRASLPTINNGGGGNLAATKRLRANDSARDFKLQAL
ncbi:hypothetical protein [Helicobacter canis]|uniref:hypothetical protein n=1 Tax=Helicobacter canis TaxID=29419 RepID=UPI0029428034|nr:hypothetical protein [Helicobacter canis]